MHNFGELQRVPLREIWSHEASNFTPWLASNIEALGDALGLELELTDREASVGEFSLDLLAKDLGSSRNVIIENQLDQTDHDHLGKLLTYAAGFDASTVIWISEAIRDEHRQTLEWLNQKTDIETQFFGVVVEVLTIDDSKPAFNFKPVVSPNEWQKLVSSTKLSPKGEKHKSYFQTLIDELREDHNFTGPRTSQPQSWYSFSSGTQGIAYQAAFVRGGKVRTALRIRRSSQEEGKNIFDALEKRKAEINSNFGNPLEWERLDEQKASRISVYRGGIIESSKSELEEIRNWHIKNLLKIKEVFAPEIEQY